MFRKRQDIILYMREVHLWKLLCIIFLLFHIVVISNKNGKKYWYACFTDN